MARSPCCVARGTVVPEFRRRADATAILHLSLEIARETLGIQRILVSCDDDNIGSIRTIEKDGGVLENIIREPGIDKAKRRASYAIDPRIRSI